MRNLDALPLNNPFRSVSRPIKVLSISHGLMGDADYHDNLRTRLKDSAAVEIIPRQMQGYSTCKARRRRVGLRINRLGIWR